MDVPQSSVLASLLWPVSAELRERDALVRAQVERRFASEAPSISIHGDELVGLEAGSPWTAAGSGRGKRANGRGEGRRPSLPNPSGLLHAVALPDHV